MITDLRKTPWPWFGGKSAAAEAVWEALGDVAHYVEPFAGSLAVLLRRPHEANRSYYSETVNDLDGLLVNAWRSMQMSPQATADAASWPVSEADLHARHIAIVRWKQERNLEHLMGDPFYHDPLIAGWWMWGQSSWIGSGWCSGKGAWTADADGRIFKQARAIGREAGVKVQRPHIGNNGQGVNHAGLREAGVGDFHPMTMPELLRWFEFLSARLRHVRILNGDWKRACTGGASKTIPVRMGDGICGFFFDPPYADTAGRVDNLYAEDSLSVAHDVREWCVANGNDKDYRIALAGFDGEHNDLETQGWTVVEWFKSGFLTGGMANTAASDGGNGVGMQQKKERLWLSPHCLTIDKAPAQGSLL